MRSLNRAAIIGHLGHAPEARLLDDGTVTASFNVATDESYRDKSTGQIIDKTEWHKVALFGRLAEIARDYLQKGSKVFVEGKLKTRKYTDKQGVERYTTEISAQNIIMLDGRRDGPTNSAPAANAPAPAPRAGGIMESPMSQNPRGPVHQKQPVDEFDDDIPF